MNKQNQLQQSRLSSRTHMVLWITFGILLTGVLFSHLVFPEHLWLTVLLGLGFVTVSGFLVKENQVALKSRTTAYSVNSLVTITLVVGILGVLNFLTSRYPLKWDLTEGKLHTLSDQTVKLMKTLDQTVKATFFSKAQQSAQFRTLLEDYKSLNPKFELEFVDPDREPTRAKKADIKKYSTLLLSTGLRENKIEEPSEEKITNALIKLLKEKSPTLCVLKGHGEKDFDSQESEGYSVVKKALADQAYSVKILDLIQEGKLPETCDAIAIMGPTKAFFPQEAKMVSQYLDNGGRAVIGLDIDLKGSEFAPELVSLLKTWFIEPTRHLVVDPLSRMFGVESSVAILASFSRSHPITKDFQSNCAFPFTRPIEVMEGAPSELNVNWIAQTTPKSWGVGDLSQLTKGEVQFTAGKDKMGPLNAAVTAEGKLKNSKATRNTRLVVFGSSFFATNNFSRYAGNLDFYLNAISWAMEDESLISIRAKEPGVGKVELSQKASTVIFLVTVILIPLVIAIGGLGIWIIRRRL